MKKAVVFGLIAAMVPGLAFAKGPQPISVYLNGAELDHGHNGPQLIRQDRTFLPLRVVAEDLGFKVDWNQDKKEIKVSKDKDQVTMHLGTKDFFFNGEKKSMDVMPFVEGERTYVPIRFVGETLGCKVEWDRERAMVLVGQYPSVKDGLKGDRVPVKELGLSYVLPEGAKDKLVTGLAMDQYTFFDRMNKEAKSEFDGRIGGFYLDKNPAQCPVPHVILAKVEGGYITFCFASDVSYDVNKPEMVKSYKESTQLVKEILKTVEFSK